MLDFGEAEFVTADQARGINAGDLKGLLYILFPPNALTSISSGNYDRVLPWILLMILL